MPSTNGKHVIDLTHGTLFLLHPEDERPFIRRCYVNYGPTFFKHSSQGLGRGVGSLSLGIAMHATWRSEEVHIDSGRMALKGRFAAMNSNNDNKKCVMTNEYVKNQEGMGEDYEKLKKNWIEYLNKYF